MSLHPVLRALVQVGWFFFLKFDAEEPVQCET